MTTDQLENSGMSRRAFIGTGAKASLAVAGIGGLGSFLAACGSGGGSSGGETSGGESKGAIGFNQPDSANPTVVPLYEGAEQEAQALGYELLKSSANLQADKQLAEINAWIAQGVKGMTVLPLNEEAMTPLIEKAHQKDIEFVGYAADVPGNDGYVWWDNLQGAQLVGEAIASWVNEELGGQAEMGLLTADFILNGRQRVHGTVDVVQKNAPGAKVVAETEAIGAPEAQKAMQSMLQAHPDLNVIICIADEGSVGAQQAFLQTKPSQERQDQMFIAGFDGSPRPLEEVLNGTTIRAVGALDLFEVGRSAVWVPANLAEGKKPTSVKHNYILITEETQAEGKKLLSKFASS